MTKLQELMDQGWKIMTSPTVQEGRHFVSGDPAGAGGVLVFHPRDYNYIAYDDIWEAHTLNMASIYAQIERRAEEANQRLDDLTDFYNHQHDPRTITFLYGTEVTENPDGSFTFYAKGGEGPSMAIATPSAAWNSEEFVKGVEEMSKAIRSMQPTFDQLVTGVTKANEAFRPFYELPKLPWWKRSWHWVEDRWFDTVFEIRTRIERHRNEKGNRP